MKTKEVFVQLVENILNSRKWKETISFLGAKVAILLKETARCYAKNVIEKKVISKQKD